MKKFLVGVILVLVSVSCQEVKKNKQLNIESDGKTVVGWYYYYESQGDYENIFQYVDSSFLESHPKEQFISNLKKREETLGKIKETNLVEWKNTGNDDKKNKTKEFEFKYEVKYSGGETKIEDFIVVQKDYEMLIHDIKY